MRDSNPPVLQAQIRVSRSSCPPLAQAFGIEICGTQVERKCEEMILSPLPILALNLRSEEQSLWHAVAQLCLNFNSHVFDSNFKKMRRKYLIFKRFCSRCSAFDLRYTCVLQVPDYGSQIRCKCSSFSQAF
ncbi:hypothetical protein HAX54_001999 [Datura stramonium]|uniref:Uncharacterized protein n=1 Tax=Datura stramonium TaxID=4076 RepID=A0ABS8T4E9_DATST|nr:hypothetical protein [Datura stramonium]